MKNKWLKILGILIIITSILLATRITFAYLAPVINKAMTDIMGSSDTVDDFKFELGDALKLDVTSTTLPEDGSNYVRTTTATAMLKSNSTKNNAEYNYYVYFQIVSNTFVYSKDGVPEIILSITDPVGNEISSLDGLEYKEYNGISGFDVTTENSIYEIASNYKITSTSSEEYTKQVWTFKLTYLNLPFDQSINMGNDMTTKIYIRKSEFNELEIANVLSSNTTSSIALNVEETEKTKEIEKYYFSIDDGTSYKESTSSTISFDNLESKKIYKVKVYGIDKYQRKTNIFSTLASTYPFSDYIIDHYTGKDTLYLHNSSLANGANDNSYRYAGGDYILTSKATSAGYTSIGNSIATGVNALIHYYCDNTRQYIGYHCQAETNDNNYYTLDYDETVKYETYQNVLDKAESDGYLTGDNVKNFVCFGTNKSPCPEENLYRIIGVFGSDVKLIKWTSATNDMIGEKYKNDTQYAYWYYSGLRNPYQIDFFKWNLLEDNNWENSDTNTEGLNINYLNYLGSYWSQKIKVSEWQIGGNTLTNLQQTASKVYQNEIVSPVENKITKAKVGLVYVSDYGFAGIPKGWTRRVDNYNSRNVRYDNWLADGVNDWTITKDSSSNKVIIIKDYGIMYYDPDDWGVIKPTFYLANNVNYLYGDGTEKNPYFVA